MKKKNVLLALFIIFIFSCNIPSSNDTKKSSKNATNNGIQSIDQENNFATIKSDDVYLEQLSAKYVKTEGAYKYYNIVIQNNGTIKSGSFEWDVTANNSWNFPNPKKKQTKAIGVGGKVTFTVWYDKNTYLTTLEMNGYPYYITPRSGATTVQY